MPYFTFTRLNLYLDPLPVIGFQLFIVLWKALIKRKQITQFLRRNFAYFLHRCRREVAHFKFSMNTNLVKEDFANIVAYLNSVVKKV